MLLGSDYIVDLELSAAQAEGRGEIISSPRVITANQKEASIEQGTEIPYQQSSVERRHDHAVQEGRAEPQGDSADYPGQSRHPRPDCQARTAWASLSSSVTGGVVPSIDTREITTQVLVNDGQTVVLGGILETERRESETQGAVPGRRPGPRPSLQDHDGNENNKDELLIFVTPKILREGVNVN
jgi:type IV pilus assembly protein PilQ